MRDESGADGSEHEPASNKIWGDLPTIRYLQSREVGREKDV